MDVVAVWLYLKLFFYGFYKLGFRTGEEKRIQRMRWRGFI